jgi:hypothetical protein
MCTPPPFERISNSLAVASITPGGFFLMKKLLGGIGFG